MYKRTILDVIEINRDGSIGLKFAKQMVDDDESVLFSGVHRALLPKDADIDTQMAAVNANLVDGLKQAAVDATELDIVKSILPMVWKT